MNEDRQDAFADRIEYAGIAVRAFLRTINSITFPCTEKDVEKFRDAWAELKEDIEEY